jgi:hypothetical protein
MGEKKFSAIVGKWRRTLREKLLATPPFFIFRAGVSGETARYVCRESQFEITSILFGAQAPTPTTLFARVALCPIL